MTTLLQARRRWRGLADVHRQNPMRPRINLQIKANPVRLVSEDGADLGLFALEDALKLVASRREDLVEIGPDSIPPVCQVIDYGKFRYRQIQALKGKRDE